MVQWHTKSRRKASGGLRRSVNARHRQLYERGGDKALTQLADSHQETKRKTVKGMGKETKTKALRVKQANVTDSSKKKTNAWEILTVKQNQANRLFVRRNIITQNAVIEVKNNNQTGYARVTSRPGQDGNVNAVLLNPEETRAFEQEIAKKTTPEAEERKAKKAEAKAKKEAESEQIQQDMESGNKKTKTASETPKKTVSPHKGKQ
jgi:small subunit ribosomal protein S8e